MIESFDERARQAGTLLKTSGSTVAFTGAGISTESGISDFRSPGGVWERHRMITYQEFISSADNRREYWQMKRELHRELSKARPNKAHLSLARLEAAGRLDCLITQNIDGLHQDAGNSPAKVIELHGTNRTVTCLGCGGTWPFEEIQVLLEGGTDIPVCGECGELVKPSTVMFGESMPREALALAFEKAQECDVFVMIGSSLQVEPAASLPRAAHREGKTLVYINRTPTPSDDLAEIIFREPAGEVFERLMEEIGPLNDD